MGLNAGHLQNILDVMRNRVTPAPQPGIMSRVGGRLGGLLGAVGQRVANGVMPDAGLGGLLGPDQIHQARGQGLFNMGLDMLANSGPTTGVAPGLGQILAHGVGAAREGYGQSLQGTLQAQQLGMQQRQLQQVQQARADVQQSLSPQPGDTREAFDSRVRQAQAYLVSHGDLEGAKGLMELVQTSKDPAPKNLLDVDLGDRRELHDPVTGALVQTIRKGMPPKDPNAPNPKADAAFALNSNRVLDDYARDTKKFDDVMGGMEVFNGAVKNPNLTTAFALADAYARVTNPGALVRPTTLEMIEHMGSVNQRFKKWYQHNANGAVPVEIVQEFKKTLSGILAEHRHHYEDTRRATLERAKQLHLDNFEPMLTKYDFTDYQPAATPAAGPSRGLLADPSSGTPNPLLR